MARVKLPSASHSIVTLPSAPWALPQVSITNGSLTDMQAISLKPAAFSLAAFSTQPGRWLAEQTGV